MELGEDSRPHDESSWKKFPHPCRSFFWFLATKDQPDYTLIFLVLQGFSGIWAENSEGDSYDSLVDIYAHLKPCDGSSMSGSPIVTSVSGGQRLAERGVCLMPWAAGLVMQGATGRNTTVLSTDYLSPEAKKTPAGREPAGVERSVGAA
jgi:hypothetical protein